MSTVLLVNVFGSKDTILLFCLLFFLKNLLLVPTFTFSFFRSLHYPYPTLYSDSTYFGVGYVGFYLKFMLKIIVAKTQFIIVMCFKFLYNIVQLQIVRIRSLCEVKFYFIFFILMISHIFSLDFTFFLHIKL